MTDKNYCQIALNIFQEYDEQELEGKLLWESIKMDFKLQTKKKGDAAINDNTWSMIKKYYILCGVWIDSYEDDNSQSKILMKLFLGKKYDTKLSDWDIDCIKEVEIEYDKLFRVIIY